MKHVIQILLSGINPADQETILQLLRDEAAEFRVAAAGTAESLASQLQEQRPQLVLACFESLTASGETQFFEQLKACIPAIPVIVIGEEDTAEAAVRYMQQGAADYIPRSKLAAHFLLPKINRIVSQQKSQNRQNQTMEAMGRITLAFNATQELSRLLDLICQESRALFNVGAAFIWLLEGEELVGFAGTGYGREGFIGMRVSLSNTTILGTAVIKEKRPMFVNNAPQSGKLDPKVIRDYHLQSILGVPLITENQAIGALMLLDNVNPWRFEQEILNQPTCWAAMLLWL